MISHLAPPCTTLYVEIFGGGHQIVMYQGMLYKKKLEIQLLGPFEIFKKVPRRGRDMVQIWCNSPISVMRMRSSICEFAGLRETVKKLGHGESLDIQLSTIVGETFEIYLSNAILAI